MVREQNMVCGVKGTGVHAELRKRVFGNLCSNIQENEWTLKYELRYGQNLDDHIT